MKRFLGGILAVGIFTGIIPAMLLVLMTKYTIISVIVGIVAIITLTKELIIGG